MNELPWKLRSQSSNQQVKLCSYVVLAEFDIDTGSTVRHQYPSKVPNHAADWLAENMLPEGTHNREVDYTYIFLNRGSKQINDEYNNGVTAASSLPSSSTSSSSTVPTTDSNSSNHLQQQNNDEYFLYGVNLCKTKYDTSVRRGAIVKAIAVFSPYHFVEILKVPLEHTLELYFDNSSLGILKNLYKCLNSIDLSSIPSPTNLDIMMMCRNNIFDYESMNTTVIKEHSSSLWNIDLNLIMKATLEISLSSKDKTVIATDATTAIANTTTAATSTTATATSTTTISAASVTKLGHNNADNNGSNNNSQNENEVFVANQTTTNEVDEIVTVDGTVDSSETDTATKVEINKTKIIDTEDTKTAMSPDILPQQNEQTQEQQYQHQLQSQQSLQQQQPLQQEYYTYNIPVSIPLYRSRDEVGNSSLISFLEILGEGTMKIYNAILAKKRVIFVGYNHSAADVAQMVLAASSLVTPVITDIIRRVYPYVNLADLSFLEVSGYMAGATNPMFLESDSWWDIACVLDLNNNTAVIRNSSSSSSDDNSIIGSVYNMYGMSNMNVNNKDKKSSVNNNNGTNGSNNNSNTNTTVNDEFSILSARDGSNMMAQITSKLVSTNLVVLDDENNNVTTIDSKFITSVLAGINVLSQTQISGNNNNSNSNSSSNNNNDSYLEEWVKTQFKEYTNMIIICTHIFSDSLPPLLSMSLSPLPSLSSKNSAQTTTASNNTNNNNYATDTNNRNNNNNNTINNNTNITDNDNNTALTNSHYYGDPYNSLASLNISSFSPRFRKFYEGNIQRAILLKDIDQIKYAHSCPWQLLSSSLSPVNNNTAAVDSTINATCAGISMSNNNSKNEIITENTNASSSSSLSPLKGTGQRSPYKINISKTQSSSSSSSSSSPLTYSVSPKPTYRHSNIRESLTNTRDSETSSMIDNDLYNEINLLQNEYFTLRKNLIRLQIEVNLDATELASILHEIHESLLTAQSITINTTATTISAATTIITDGNNISNNSNANIDNNKENSQNNENTHNCGEFLVQIMCVIFSENLGGFHPILSALFSQNPQARLHAVNILNFLEQYDSTRYSLGKMNNMLKNAYNRQKQKLQDGSLFNGIKRYDAKMQRMLLAQTTSTINNREKNNKSPSTATVVQSSSVLPTKIDYNSYIDAFDLLS